MKSKKTVLRVKKPLRDKVKIAAKKDKRTLEAFVENALIAALPK